MEKTMKGLRSSLVISLSIVGFLLAVTTAKADTLSITLDSPVQYGLAGDTLLFYATVTNNDLTEVFLNGDSGSIIPPALTVDADGDDPFFDYFPPSLSPGESYYAELFDVYIPDGTPLGLYAGTFVIQGGSDEYASDTLGSAVFDVKVTDNLTDNGGFVPEPSSLVLLLTGMTGLTGIIRRQLIQFK
ncbi:MAG: PEP-CTERM sorting domain-containing protein [Terracidiphilus sp.]